MDTAYAIDCMMEEQEAFHIDEAVTPGDLAIISAAYRSMQETYHERDPHELIRFCCHSLAVAKAKDLKCKMALLISQAQMEMGTFRFQK